MADFILNEKEITVLAELAKQYMEIASLPKQKETIALWNKLNQGNMERPMVTIDQLPWNELNIDNFLDCEVSDPYWRGVEWGLRSTILQWRYFPADMVVNPYILLGRPLITTGYGIQSDTEISVSDEKNSVVGQIYHSQLKTMEDIEKIKTPTAKVNPEAEKIIIQQAELAFGGIAPIKFGGVVMHLGIWDSISQWMGVEDCYFNVVDDPDLVHAVMERCTRAMLDYIDNLNDINAFDVYSNLCHCSYTFNDNDPRNANIEKGIHTSQNAWAFGLAQLFSSVSPQVTDEFEVPYMQRLFPKFANIYYGCCDRLDDRLDIIMKMPNIRKISCSPWSNRNAFAANLPKDIIMSNKPSPAFLVPQTMDYDNVVDDVKKTMAAAKNNGVGLELILKDVSTILYQTDRLVNWEKVVMESVKSW